MPNTNDPDDAESFDGVSDKSSSPTPEQKFKYVRAAGQKKQGHAHHHDDNCDHDHDEEDEAVDDHAGHSHSHHGHHHHDDVDTTAPFPWRRVLIGAVLVMLVIATASIVQVRSGMASVVTRFGNPARVLLLPGLAWRWPAPFETIVPVDLRLRTTSSGLQDAGTRDGLRIIVQAYVAWQVQPDASNVQRFMRAVQNQPDEAARQIRTFVGSALETTAAAYDLVNLVNTDAKQVKISDFEIRLRNQIEAQLLATYGVRVMQVGIERLTLPSVTLAATVDRMRAERETIATERTAVGKRQAAEIRATAVRDARIIQADALAKAATIEAQSRVQAAALYGKAYNGSPQLYNMLRSLDTLSSIVNPQTKLILRTDAAPFRVLIDAPQDIERAHQPVASNGKP